MEPRKSGVREWLSLADDEVDPRIIESVHPGLVVWSSLWPDRPNDQLRFTIADDGGGGSRLKWCLLSPDEPPDDRRLARMRYRINYLINQEMRYTFG